MLIHFHIITLFPEALTSYLDASIVGRARREKKIKVSFYNPRDFTTEKHARVDKKPYSGGPGMVLQAEPILRAVKKALSKCRKLENAVETAPTKFPKPVIYFLEADGAQFDNEQASKLAKKVNDIIIICGHYEGIDARVVKILKAKPLSVGPYILTGGELPALIIIDAISRQVKGVLGNFASIEEKRVVTSEVYTRPEIFRFEGKNYRVPKVLLSGDHKKIEEWKRSKKK
jgi:tRNA (guanine37-N1)-methyltransferase